MGRLLQLLRPKDQETKTNIILTKLRHVDIAVFVEVPSQMLVRLRENREFYVFHADEKELDTVDNTVLLARKSKFEDPKKLDLVDVATEKQKLRKALFVGALLTTKQKQPKTIKALGVHLASSGRDFPETARWMEELLANGTIDDDTLLLGDINQDFMESYKKKILDKKELADQLPLFQKFVEGNKDRDVLGQFVANPNSSAPMVTSRKQRSLFQTQVSKAGKIDAAWKDWALVGKNLNVNSALPEGAVSNDVMLPSGDCPSDHAALIFGISDMSFDSGDEAETQK